MPEDHFGTWGENEEKEKIQIYTDGSLTLKKGRNEAGWAAAIHNDWYEKNWRELHERNHEGYRRKQIKTKMDTWGGQIHRAESSYTTEMEAITKMLMIIPITWDVEIITDSKSAIDTIERMEARGVNDKDNEWQLRRIIKEVLNRRKGKIIWTHQKSHKKWYTKKSIGNAVADLKAEDYTKGYEC